MYCLLFSQLLKTLQKLQGLDVSLDILSVRLFCFIYFNICDYNCCLGTPSSDFFGAELIFAFKILTGNRYRQNCKFFAESQGGWRCCQIGSKIPEEISSSGLHKVLFHIALFFN